MISPPVLPPPLRPGDKVGVAALSGPVVPERLAAGLAALEELGYQPVEAANLRSAAGLFAGTDDQRLDAFHRLAADPDVKAIVFARGGYGVQRILPRVDWRLLAEHPPAYVGYSDLTPFLYQVVARLGLVAFHGPMVAADLARGLERLERASFEAALAGHLEAEIPVRFLSGGEEAAEGPLLGGCLAMLTSTLGTPYAPDLERAILFFEDIGEPAFRIDRMLTHLRLGGQLTDLAGVVAGHLTGAVPEGPEAPSGEELLRDLATGYPWPAAAGLCAGHACPNLTLPLGAWARLDPGRRSLLLGAPSP